MRPTPVLAVALLALPLAPAGARAAKCSHLHTMIREQVLRLYNTSLDCEDLLYATKMLPIQQKSAAAGDWAFKGESALRHRLRREYGIYPPEDVLPLGYVERQAPAGISMVLVFGLAMPDREWAIYVMANLGEELSVEEGLVTRLGEGVWYDRMGVHVRDDEGRYSDRGTYLDMERGGLWGKHQPEPEALRLCEPCRGWLCPREPVVCFSDFNDSGDEELHLTDDCRGGTCGLAVLEPRRSGELGVVLNAKLKRARWEERPEGWALVPELHCRSGVYCVQGGMSLGNPRCKRPKVMLIRRGARKAEASAALRDKYFPESERPLPRACRLRKGRRIRLWDPKKGFVIYYR